MSRLEPCRLYCFGIRANPLQPPLASSPRLPSPPPLRSLPFFPLLRPTLSLPHSPSPLRVVPRSKPQLRTVSTSSSRSATRCRHSTASRARVPRGAPSPLTCSRTSGRRPAPSLLPPPCLGCRVDGLDNSQREVEENRDTRWLSKCARLGWSHPARGNSRLSYVNREEPIFTTGILARYTFGGPSQAPKVPVVLFAPLPARPPIGAPQQLATAAASTSASASTSAPAPSTSTSTSMSSSSSEATGTVASRSDGPAAAARGGAGSGLQMCTSPHIRRTTTTETQ